MKTITIILFSILLNGCGNTKEANISQNMKQAVNENLSGTFFISKLAENTTLTEELTIQFDNSTKKVSGFSGCNRFFGNYQVNNNKIAFKNLASTEKMCGDEINKIESYLLKSLRETDNFKIKNNEIIFLKKKKELLTAKQDNTPTQVKQAQSNTMTFEYKAFTRATYKMVKVNQKEITAQLSRSEKATTKTCAKTDWDKLMKLTEGLRASSISELEAPSKAHQFDGAAHATLTITDGEDSYTTPTFDAGNPPKEIAELVNTVINLATTKQEKKGN